MNTFLKMCGTLCLILPYLVGYGQVDNTNNLGFEKGTFEGWTLSYGNVKLINNRIEYQNSQNGTIQDRHLIVSKSQGNDPKINMEAIPMVSKEGNYAMRIGKTVNGNTWERASTTFKITADHTLFQYHFAVLLQEDVNRHSQPQKPGFSLKITDLAGTQITCGDFDVQLEGNLLAGFKVQGDIEYKNWTTGAIDLRQHVGKTLKVEVTAHGCTGQGHFGYAYFDAELLKSEIKQASVCPDINGKMTLLAPDGFEKYQWSNGSQNKALSAQAVLGEPFKVTITPFSSLDAACNFSLYYTVPFKTTNTNLKEAICDGENFKIDDEVYKTTGNYTKIISRGGICDSTVNLDLLVNTVPKINAIFNKCEGESVTIRDSIIKTSGNYRIRIQRAGKCDSIVNANVNFEKLEIKATENQSITIGDPIMLVGETITGVEGSTRWLSATQELCNACHNITLEPIFDQNFYFETVSQTGLCKRTDTTSIKVVPCTVHFPDSFSPNSDPLNAKFFGLGSKCVAKILSLIVFDRWGEQVFITENIPVSDENFGWDGKKDGRELAAGLYSFVAKAQLLDGSIEQFKGPINLLR
ncbi:gliding motility-associated C-terminal domain-containing protein [Lacihabitans sp. CS3-21]|uniref:T9SS type B sorting domain-containing protein n=1 Tax=Lacihabitans sp. CS3-21 TaxID=2487332 RepID=UPI0020CEBA78|nr:gliding motility-associated C-terminal domain-containing protein [Lacihabitans sp. CS3-21]MCP9745364.1 gliding motility-associated C-terminal domain-containing protein [Lacihabitans sp. CS3-21]